MSTFTPAPTYADPVIVDAATGKSQFNPLWLKWFLDVAQFISVNGGTSGTAVDHNSLSGLQGGTANQFYHLTAAEQGGLTGGGDSNLHYHSADRAAGVSATIVTAKLTALGANGSMTFTNGVLTAHVDAT